MQKAFYRVSIKALILKKDKNTRGNVIRPKDATCQFGSINIARLKK